MNRNAEPPGRFRSIRPRDLTRSFSTDNNDANSQFRGENSNSSNVKQRIGPKNFLKNQRQNFRRNNFNKKNNNPNNNQQQNHSNSNNTNTNNQQNRKRFYSDNNSDMGAPSRKKWNHSKNNLNHSKPHRSMQDRLHRIKNESTSMKSEYCDDDIQIYQNNDDSDIVDSKEFNQTYDSQDFDATDITVQVINTAATSNSDAVRFQMVLDPNHQLAIKKIQSKTKQKQVIYPYPITPNMTGMTTHERFSILS